MKARCTLAEPQPVQSSQGLTHTTDTTFLHCKQFDANASVGAATDETGIPDGWMGLDIGPKSIEK